MRLPLPGSARMLTMGTMTTFGVAQEGEFRNDGRKRQDDAQRQDPIRSHHDGVSGCYEFDACTSGAAFQMSNLNRPLSPHLQVYRPQLTSVLSIAHRITGVALFAGIIALTIWLLSLAGGEQSFVRVSAIIGSALGQLILFTFTLAMFYHLCNGIRHLFWDAGYGFELDTVYTSGKAVLVATVVLTIVIWAAAMMAGSSGA